MWLCVKGTVASGPSVSPVLADRMGAVINPHTLQQLIAMLVDGLNQLKHVRALLVNVDGAAVETRSGLSQLTGQAQLSNDTTLDGDPLPIGGMVRLEVKGGHWLVV